jgi:ATP-binding cassette subfamily B protein/ATP-binding cassette subfamily C protein
MIRTEKERLTLTLKALKKGFLVVIAFSAGVNILMLATPLYMLQVYDRVLTSRSLDTLLWLSIVVIVALLTMAFLEGARTSLMVRLNNWLEKHLSGPLLTSSVFGHLRLGAESSVQGLRDLATFKNFFTGPGIFPVMDMPWTPIYIAVIFMLHPVLGWVSIGGAILLFLIAIFNELSTRKLLQQAGAENIKALNQASSAVRNADAIEAMGFLPNLINRWNKISDESIKSQSQASHRSAVFTSMSKFFRLALQTAMLGGGAYYTVAGEMTAGGMIAASILMGRAVAPIDQAINSWKAAVSARSAYARIKTMLSKTPLRGLAMPMPAPTGKLSIEKLTFSFPGTREMLLRGISFELEPGDLLGLIGPSGAGKTTLSRLILGNLEPMQGHARLDGMDMATWEPEDRGRYVGYLPQDVELFSGTIKDNIARMGEVDPEMVIEAAELAGVHELISRMPHGYDTEIGEGGKSLSGGERQRIALARALYANPKLIVLDEPNASLDANGEQLLFNTLMTLKAKSVTQVVISHRRGLLQQADKILVLNNGGIQAFGPRDEVLKQMEQASG